MLGAVKDGRATHTRYGIQIKLGHRTLKDLLRSVHGHFVQPVHHKSRLWVLPNLQAAAGLAFAGACWEQNGGGTGRGKMVHRIQGGAVVNGRPSGRDVSAGLRERVGAQREFPR